MELTVLEVRLLGAMMEKAVTTPDQYPMSRNALTTACNQKTNRDPVMSLAEEQVQDTLDALMKKRLVSEVRVGSRVAKYQHRFCNTEFSELKLSKQQQALICLLFLRGAQTPGELRSRCGRLCEFRDVQEVETALNELMEKPGGPYVARLDREPGRRECRYVHLLGDHHPESVADYPVQGDDTDSPGDTRGPGAASQDREMSTLADSRSPDASPASVDSKSGDRSDTLADRVDHLEFQLSALQNEVVVLREALAALTDELDP